MKPSRYDRQTRLPEWGKEGQRSLEDKSAVILGAGATGNVTATELCEVGIGRICIVDFDRIEMVNLNRTPMFTEQDIGRYKAEALSERLRQKNADIDVRYSVSRAEELDGNFWKNWDVIFSCLDNWASRETINAWAVALGIPLIDCGTHGFLGRVQTYLPKDGWPCLQCNPFWKSKTQRIRRDPRAYNLNRRRKERRRIEPQISMTSGLVGSIAVSEFVKLNLGIGKFLDSCIFVDLRSSTFTIERYNKNPRCPVCSYT